MKDQINTIRKKLKKTNILVKDPVIWTDKQNVILKTYMNDATKGIFLDGAAGTGKTVLSVYAALTLLQQGKADKIIYVRSIVESAQSRIGFLKGGLEEKVEPYFEVVNDKLQEMLTEQEISYLLTEGKIQTIPVSFLRGRDFKNSIIIIDESQNLVFSELTTIISRVADNSKIIFLFDSDQSDLCEKHKNDIVDFKNIFNTKEAEKNGIFSFRLEEEDIMRSEFCKFVMISIKKYKNSKYANKA